MSALERVAVVGLGSIGRRHIRILRELRPDLHITGVRSAPGPTDERLSVQRTVFSLQEAIADGIQAAVIASPAPAHIAQAIELATAGCHLLIEKPLSPNLSGVDQLRQQVHDNQLTALVGYVLRHDEAAQQFNSMLEEGASGNVLSVFIECGSYLPDWRPERDYRDTVSARQALGGGVLLELSHELDYASWCFGPFHDIQAKLQRSGSLELDVEDQAQLLLSNADSVPVTILLDFCRRTPTRRCVVQGQAGELTLDLLRHRVTMRGPEGVVFQKQFDADPDAKYRQQLRHFLDCVERSTAPRVTIDDAAAVVRIVDAARRANSAGASVRL